MDGIDDFLPRTWANSVIHEPLAAYEYLSIIEIFLETTAGTVRD